jgi:hypothetical protein
MLLSVTNNNVQHTDQSGIKIDAYICISVHMIREEPRIYSN